MRLAEFILDNVEPILREWEAFARSLDAGAKLERLVLRDHAEAILRACVRDMCANQSRSEQSSKSKGHGGASSVASERLDDASSVHGVGRVGSGFDLNELVAEYRALRASVLRLWRESGPSPDLDDLADITRFNEAVDQSLATAVAGYTHRVDQSRRMFLAILSHDLRNPLNSIRMSASLALLGGKLDPDSSEALALIDASVEAISRLIKDLLDFAATGLGEHIPLVMEPANLDLLCREVVQEFRAAHPDRTLLFESIGEVACNCDSARIRQVISNLIGNALQHGSVAGPVSLSLRADSDDHRHVVMVVHNEGPPIPEDLLPTIFDPLVRDMSTYAQQRRRPGSIGLGLYIAHQVVTAHGGRIDVTSTADQGTTFTVRIPRTA